MALVIGRRSQEASIEAGQLDRRVVLLKPETSDEGDEIASWTPVATVFASVRPGSAPREVDLASREVAIVYVTVTIRYRSDVDARWRIQDRDAVYEVSGAPIDPLRRHIQLQLVCEEIL